MNPVIKVENLTYQHGDATTNALENIDFEVREGEFYCIIGKNGSGKSTLCNALVGLIPHYFAGKMNGKVIIYGKETTDMTIGEISST